MRRICLFSGFDKGNKIQDYVVFMVKKLAEISDVYYMGNGKISPEELLKIAPYTKMFYQRVHYLKDFGNWNYLISKLGWDKLMEYDEVIFCNDSVYGPLCDLNDVFAKMERRNYDFWGITANREHNFYLHRYFMVFNKNVVQNKKFQDFWRVVPLYSNVSNCEQELTPLLICQGFICNSYVRYCGNIDVLLKPEKLVDDYGVPFVKTKCFLPDTHYSFGTGVGLRLKIRKQTNYDMRLINKHIKENKLPQTWQQKFMSFAGL